MRTRWLIWRWAVSTFGYRKAYRMWRNGIKSKTLRKLRINSAYGKCPLEDEW